MSSLEQKRSALEEIECYERMVVELLDTEHKVHRERLLQSHRVSRLLDVVVERSEAVAALAGLQRDNYLLRVGWGELVARAISG